MAGIARLFELDIKDTFRSLACRPFLSAKCCGSQMRQKDVFSILPSDDIPFGRSQIILVCNICRKEIELELILGAVKKEDVLNVFEIK